MLLVTGATGFIGKNLVPVLAAESRMRILVRPTSDITFCRGNPQIEIVTGNLERGYGLERALEGVDTVIHVAGRITGRRRSDFYRINVRGTENLLAAMRRTRSSNIVYISSYAACGLGPNQKELSESSTASPVCLYGRSKQEAESAVVQSGLRFIILRPPAVYGPHDIYILPIIKLIDLGFHPVPGTGDRYIDFIYIRDLVDIIKKIIGESIVNERVYFVNDGCLHAFSEVVRLIGDILGKKRLFKFNIPGTIGMFFAVLSDALLPEKMTVISRGRMKLIAQQSLHASSECAMKDLGFRPAYDLKTGMTETIAWYRDNGFLK